MALVLMDSKHYADLYRISQITDTWVKHTRESSDKYFSTCFGWVLVHGNDIVGYIVFSNYQPELDISIHASVLPQFRGRWLTKGIYKTVFNHAFDLLKCKRVTSWRVHDYTDPNWLPRLGFVEEGVARHAFVDPNGVPKNVTMYSMLPDERRWK